MAEDNADLFAEFQEFLTQKKASQDAEKEAEDFEVEFWDEKGRGVRTKRSHAKPFLQQFGIDADADDKSDDSGSDNTGKQSGKNDSKGSGQPKGTATGSKSVTRKYFVKGK